MLAPLIGCVNKGGYVTTEYCLVSGLIIASERDTPETLKQILEHNSKYQELCVD